MTRWMLTLLAVLLTSPAGAEMRGLWVVRTALVSPQSVDQVVDQAAAGGFNALFVQVRGRGDAFYDSRSEPRSVLIRPQAGDFDPLGRLIERARTRGLSVHAWINVLLSQDFPLRVPAGHVLAEHPDWVMIPRSAGVRAARIDPRELTNLARQAARGTADVEGLYLSPSAAGVPEHLEGVVRELLRGYPVAGLHLDFIRYPSADYDYSPAALRGYERATGRREAWPEPRAFAEYKRATLTALAERLAGAARAERPGLQVSAAVIPDEATAVNHKCQDWPRWLASGVLDAIAPMAYTENSRVFRAQVERARELAGPQKAVWAGVGAYRLQLPGIVEKIQVARQSGMNGVILFSQDSLTPGDFVRLRQAVFAPPPVAALRSDAALVLAGAGAAR